jgi:formate dehydrogenase (NADP+) beta subunit
MRTNIPVPPARRVLDEEIGYILDMGVDLRYNTPVESMEALLREGYDAVFVGSGAPRARTSTSPAATTATASSSASTGSSRALRPHHVDRAARAHHRRRQHGHGLLPHGEADRRDGREGHGAPRPQHFKASPWELEDAEEELVEIVENHAPKRFVIEDGRSDGMEFDRVEWYDDNGRQKSRTLDTVIIPCDA